MTRRGKIMIAVPLAVVAGLVALFAVVGPFAGRDGASGGSSATSAAAEGPGDRRRALGDRCGRRRLRRRPRTARRHDRRRRGRPAASAPSAHYLLRTGDLSLLVARGTLLPRSTASRA